MTWKHTLSLGAMALVCAGLAATARGEAADQPQSPPRPPETQGAKAGAEAGSTSSDYRFLTDGTWEDPSQCVVRFGYWGSSTSGSPVKVGEYQDLNASPFYDVDGLRSDGQRTLNYTITGTDSETNAVNLNFYRPGVEANVNYQRFPHDLGHENLGEFPFYTPNTPPLPYIPPSLSPNTGANTQFREQDLNPGEDSAIRVQEVKSNFKWKVNDNLKVRLDVWGYYKDGERQVNAMQECYNFLGGHPAVTAATTANCHVLTQMQHINWQTTEVTPAIELNLGPVVVEYSHFIRQFTANDQDVDRWYQSSVASVFPTVGYMQYGVVPDSTTQTDRLKISGDLGDSNKIYAFLFAGSTRASDTVLTSGPSLPLQPDGEQVVNQQFSGADVRWTNTSIKNVTITTYGRTIAQNNEPQNTLLNDDNIPKGLPTTYVPSYITPIDYQRTQFGTRADWRPFGRGFGLGGLAIDCSYEYSDTHRVGLGSESPGTINVPAGLAGTLAGTITSQKIEDELIEENTISNTITIGPSVRWSSELDTYIHYKWCETQDPLFATNAYPWPSVNPLVPNTTTATYSAVALNSALPTLDNEIEIGGTLMPSDRFLLNAWFGIDIQSQNIGEAVVLNYKSNTSITSLPAVPNGFSSQSFPFGINGSYRATDQLTINGGFAYYTNFIDQGVAFGASGDHTFTPYGLLQNQWGYASRASVFTLGSRYDITPKLRFTAQAEFVKGVESAYQTAGDPRFPATTAILSGIPQYLRQDVTSTRLSAGIDYQLSPHWSTYFRYVLFIYEDSADQEQIATSLCPVTGLPLSGTSNMFLAGVTGRF